MDFESYREPLLHPRGFALRMLRYGLLASGLIAVSLAIGMVGYHYFAQLDWVDSLLNASMILTGMGPVAPLHTTAAKLFASVYAIFSGVAFLSTVSLLLAPAAHRFLHRFHLDELEAGDSQRPDA